MKSTLTLYLRWILANAFGELLGLGATFAIGIGLFSGLAQDSALLPTLLTAVLMTALGVIEGSLVGWLQWRVLHRPLPDIAFMAWMRATILGAVIAWGLGAIVMTLGSLSAPSGGQTVQEPDPTFMLVMEIMMGLAAGLILAYPQWRVLRSQVQRAWLWLPANSLAWAIGMPLIFAGVDQAMAAGGVWEGVLLFALHLLLTGALVGLVHGLVLVRFASQPTPAQRPIQA
jgi:hypothetical protein